MNNYNINLIIVNRRFQKNLFNVEYAMNYLISTLYKVRVFEYFIDRCN